MKPLQANGGGHDYAAIARDLGALLEGERDTIANLANTSALLWERLPELNWVGFYLMRGSGLVVGPFQGKVACVRIAVGEGVCGTAAQRRETIVVPDVHAFPGHIACDSASESEIVIPLIERQGARAGRLVGVLDVDSPRLARFGEEDREGLERIASIVIDACDWP